jgi:hypothetical protein
MQRARGVRGPGADPAVATRPRSAPREAFTLMPSVLSPRPRRTIGKRRKARNEEGLPNFTRSPPPTRRLPPGGPETWARVSPFYPHHDPTHFAVESALGLQPGIFGLIAAGWVLDNFV